MTPGSSVDETRATWPNTKMLPLPSRKGKATLRSDPWGSFSCWAPPATHQPRIPAVGPVPKLTPSADRLPHRSGNQPASGPRHATELPHRSANVGFLQQVQKITVENYIEGGIREQQAQSVRPAKGARTLTSLRFPQLGLAAAEHAPGQIDTPETSAGELFPQLPEDGPATHGNLQHPVPRIELQELQQAAVGSTFGGKSPEFIRPVICPGSSVI